MFSQIINVSIKQCFASEMIGNFYFCPLMWQIIFIEFLIPSFFHSKGKPDLIMNYFLVYYYILLLYHLAYLNLLHLYLYMKLIYTCLYYNVTKWKLFN